MFESLVFRLVRTRLGIFQRKSYFHSSKYSSNSFVERSQRLQKLKSDDALCKNELNEGQFVLFAKDRTLLKVEDGKYSICYNSYNDIRQYFQDEDQLIESSALLNIGADFKCSFALSLPDKTDAVAKDVELKTAAMFIKTRPSFFLLQSPQTEIVSQGVGILGWNRRFRFCPRCGSKLLRLVSGWQKNCSSCRGVQYPQTSPVVITLLSNESNTACVLVHHIGHYKGIYTAIAGYLEIGETIEDAVRREIAEEIGLGIKSFKYLNSQHWPGPTSSLMIGCLAVTDETQIKIDKDELEDARWISVDEVEAALKLTDECKDFDDYISNGDNNFLLPPKPALAPFLIREWLNQIK